MGLEYDALSNLRRLCLTCFRNKESVTGLGDGQVLNWLVFQRQTPERDFEHLHFVTADIS